MTEGKICTSCGQYKFLYEYYKNKNKPMGVECQCKQCRKIVKQLHYQNNKEKYKQCYQSFIERNSNYRYNYYLEKKNIKKYYLIKFYPLKMAPPKSQNNKNYIKEIINISGINIDDYFRKIKKTVKNIVLSFHNVKFELNIKTIYSKPLAMCDKIERYYNSGYIKLVGNNNFDDIYNFIIEKYKAWDKEHQGKESGLIFDEIENTEIRAVKVNSINGSSYFDLGVKFNSLLNIQNDDNNCFAYSVVAGILYELKQYPEDYPNYSNEFKRMEKDPRRVNIYKNNLNLINMENIKSPVNIDSIERFEKQNNNIAINVFGVEEDLLDTELPNFNKEKQETNLRNIYTIHRTKFRERAIEIDLLYVTLDDKKHFCLIKNFNAYINNSSKNKRLHCRRCLAKSYTTQNALENHYKTCDKNKVLKYKMPKGEYAKCKFENFYFKEKLPFVGYADFESVNIKFHHLNPELSKLINKLRIKYKQFNFNSKIKKNDFK